MAAGLLVTPYLVDELGPAIYGLWILIASLTNYFGFLDLGIRGAVGRNIAFFRARHDSDGVSAVLNTALLMLGGVAAVAMLCNLVLAYFFFDLFDVPPRLVDKVNWTMVIVGVNLGVVLLFNAFDATLWAYQRFDILNAVDIPAAFLRTGLIFYFIVLQGRGLITLALLTLAITLYCGIFKTWFSFRIDPKLRLRPSLATRKAARQLFGYGAWYFLLSLSRLMNTQMGPAIVSSRLGIAAVTPFSICNRLIGYASNVMVAATGVLTPLATQFHAQKERDRQRALFLDGSKYCTALSLFFLALFLFLGRPLLGLWMGPAWTERFELVAIVALGEALPMSQMVTWNILLGMARHPFLAICSLVENLVAVPLSVFLIHRYGLAGFCLAFAAPAFVFRGIMPIFYGCSLMDVPLARYARHVLLPTLSIWIPTALGLFGLVSITSPDSWIKLFAYTVLFGAAYLSLVGGLLIGWDRIRPLLKRREEPDIVESLNEN
jgi:O-antigen/teichoic acid export membrane protein